MSLWDTVKKFTQPYADDYDEYSEGPDDYEEEPPRRSRAADPEPAARQESASTGSAPRSGFTGQVVNMNANKQEIVLFHPEKISDCEKAGLELRNKKAVIINLEGMDKGFARRVVDIMSGCAFALDAKVKDIADSTYLFCPYSMEYSEETCKASPKTEGEGYI